MNKKKLIGSFLIDILCACIALCVFAYFHHIRMFWNNSDTKDPGGTVIVKPEEPSEDHMSDTESRTESSGTKIDTSGQFGHKFGYLFAQSESEFVATATVYKSHDVFITMAENNSMVNEQNVQYFVYDIYVRNIDNLYTHSRMRGRIEFSDMISGCNILPIAAISGDFCGNANASKEVIRNGTELRMSDFITLDLCVLGWDGQMTMFKPSEYSHDALMALAPYQVWNFGPVLIRDGVRMTDYSERTDIGGRNPRIAIGEIEPGHYVFVCVDGRSSDSVGCQLGVLSKIMQQTGAVQAYNLDGGASAYAYFNETYLRYGDQGKTPRTLYDIVCVGEVK